MSTDYLAKLPLELVLDTCRYLPTESIVCLALSTKELYQFQELRNLWQPRMDRNQPIFGNPEVSATRDFGPDKGEREMLHLRRDILNHELLRTLELLHRDLPDHWLCDYCVKLHLRVAFTEGGRAYSPCDESRRQGSFYCLPTWNYKFPFENAQQVVKQHILGVPHGSPLTILERDPEWETVSDWSIQPLLRPKQLPLVWYRQLKVTPEILNHGTGPALELWTEQHLCFPGDYMDVLRSRSRDWVGDIGRIAQAHFSVCCHRHETGRDVADLLERPGTGFIANSRLRSCDVCLTEYCFFIWPGNCTGSIHVVLSTWITLGSCRHSFSPAWLTSSWLSSGHIWVSNFLMSGPARPFHNNNSAFYSDSTITRAVISKRGTIFRDPERLWRLSPSWSDEPEQMRSWIRTELLINTIDGEDQAETKWQRWWQKWQIFLKVS
jgi:hypothetical protein